MKVRLILGTTLGLVLLLMWLILASVPSSPESGIPIDEESSAASIAGIDEVSPTESGDSPGHATKTRGVDDGLEHESDTEVPTTAIEGAEVIAPEPVDSPSSSESKLESLYVSGSVCLPDGSPAIACALNAQSLGAMTNWTGKSDESGSFRLGPFPPSTVLIRAWTEEEAYEAELQVQAGDDRVQVKLEPLGTLKVSVLDQDGNPVRSGFEAIATSSRRPWFSNRLSVEDEVEDESEFEIPGLLPGSYDVCVVTSDSRMGCATAVSVTGSGSNPDVAITVRAAGSLEIVYFGGYGTTNCQVRFQDMIVQHRLLVRGEVTRVVVPLGDLEVDTSMGAEHGHREIHVSAGSTMSLMVP